MPGKKKRKLTLEEKRLQVFISVVAQLGEFYPDYVVAVRSTDGTALKFSDRNWATGCMRRALLEWDAMDRTAAKLAVEDKLMGDSE